MSCKHDIRNAILGYSLERRHIYKAMIEIAKAVNQQDKHIKRIEKALMECAAEPKISRTPPLLERIKTRWLRKYYRSS